jgi:hypothetical protein
VDPWQRACRDPVAIHVQVAVEDLQLLDLFGAEDLASIRPVAVVPPQAATHPVIHPDVQIGHEEDGGLKALGQIEGIYGQVEALLGVRREESDVLGVPVRGVCHQHQVSLLGPGRHAGGGSRTLDIDEDARDLGVIGEPDELPHEGDPRTAGGRKRPGPCPTRPDHHAGSRQLVLRLEDAELLPPRLRVDAVPVAEGLERIHEGRGGSDRIPGTHGGSSVDAPESGGRIAIHEDVVRRGIHALQTDRKRTVEVLPGVVVAQPDGQMVRFHERGLAAELLLQQPLHHVGVDSQQRRERTHVSDVLHQDALSRALEVLHAHLP